MSIDGVARFLGHLREQAFLKRPKGDAGPVYATTAVYPAQFRKGFGGVAMEQRTCRILLRPI